MTVAHFSTWSHKLHSATHSAAHLRWQEEAPDTPSFCSQAWCRCSTVLSTLQCRDSKQNGSRQSWGIPKAAGLRVHCCPLLPIAIYEECPGSSWRGVPAEHTAPRRPVPEQCMVIGSETKTAASDNHNLFQEHLYIFLIRLALQAT